MSTRATVTVKEDGAVLARFYHHSDGYPSWLGRELAEFTQSGVFVNGLSVGGKELQFNGAGCYAAALIKHLKDGPGRVYMIARTQVKEYNYIIDIDHPLPAADAVTVFVSIKSSKKLVWRGTPLQLLEWIKTPEAAAWG